jgi:hypothetical protein
VDAKEQCSLYSASILFDTMADAPERARYSDVAGYDRSRPALAQELQAENHIRVRISFTKHQAGWLRAGLRPVLAAGKADEGFHSTYWFPSNAVYSQGPGRASLL